MKILYLNARYAPDEIGGPAHSTRYIAEQVVREGHQALVYCRSPRPGLRQDERAGVRVVRAGPDVSMATVMQSLLAAMARGDADVLHAVHPSGLPVFLAAEAARARRIPIVQTLVSFDLLCRHSFMRAGKPCASQCQECVAATGRERSYLHQADAVVGVSAYMLDVFRRSGMLSPEQRQAVIHQAYAPSRAPSPSPAVAGKLRLAFVGRLDPLKGLDRLLAALTGPALADRSWQLDIAGSGEASYVEALKAAYPDPRIRFLGFVEPGPILDASDVLVAPALWEEPFGRIVIEAYAHGIPVVASRRGGMAETVEHEGTGLLYDPDDASALTTTLLRCLESPRWLQGLGARARARWQEGFTPAVVAGRYLDIYSGLQASHPAH